jgi:ABC-type multidrug transport system permease subunit
MKNFAIWVYILGAVTIAVAANSLSTIWAKEEDKLSSWLLVVILVSPFVYISFGLIASKVGLSIASGVVDSLLTITTT